MLIGIQVVPCYSQEKLTRIELKVIRQGNKNRSGKNAHRLKIGYEKYDAHGNIIEKASLNGNPFYNVYFDNYDSHDRIMKREFWSFHAGKKVFLIDSTLFFYDGNGKPLRETEYTGTGEISRIKNFMVSGHYTTSTDSVFKIEKNGSRTWDTEGVDTMVYDIQKRITSVTHYLNGKFLYRQVYQYHHEGKIKTEIRFDDQPDHLWSITEWTYDSNHKIIQELWKVIGGTNEKKIYQYDSKDRLSKISFYSNDRFIDYNVLEYIPSN